MSFYIIIHLRILNKKNTLFSCWIFCLSRLAVMNSEPLDVIQIELVELVLWEQWMISWVVVLFISKIRANGHNSFLSLTVPSWIRSICSVVSCNVLQLFFSWDKIIWRKLFSHRLHILLPIISFNKRWVKTLKQSSKLKILEAQRTTYLWVRNGSQHLRNFIL